MFLAVLLDKEIRGQPVLPERPLPAGRAVAGAVGFIWQLIYSRDQGLLNARRLRHGHRSTGSANPHINLWAIAGRRQLAPHRLHHDAVPGRPEGGRPVAARGRRHRRRERVADVPHASSSRCCGRSTSSSLVVTVIESLRAFDIVYVINKGTQRARAALGAGHAATSSARRSRIGFGSAMAVILLVISLSRSRSSSRILLGEARMTRRQQRRPRSPSRPPEQEASSRRAVSCLHVFLSSSRPSGCSRCVGALHLVPALRRHGHPRLRLVRSPR